MLDANLTAAADVIAFNIPGTGEKHIYLLSALPVITYALTIDGFTLQTRTNLASPGNWTDVATAPATIAGQYYSTNNLGGSQRFFRLYKP